MSDNIITFKDAKEKGLTRYFTGKPCKRGHISERSVSGRKCVECRRERERSTSVKEHKRNYYLQNREYKLEKAKETFIRNRDKIYVQRKEYYKNSEDQKIRQLCRALVHRVLNKRDEVKTNKSEEILGYSKEELKEAMTTKFLDGMSWDNYGEWHVDHVYPVSRLFDVGVTDAAVINSLDNLIPMWSDHNLSKHNKTLREFLDINPDLYPYYSKFLKAGDRVWLNKEDISDPNINH